MYKIFTEQDHYVVLTEDGAVWARIAKKGNDINKLKKLFNIPDEVDEEYKFIRYRYGGRIHTKNDLSGLPLFLQSRLIHRPNDFIYGQSVVDMLVPGDAIICYDVEKNIGMFQLLEAPQDIWKYKDSFDPNVDYIEQIVFFDRALGKYCIAWDSGERNGKRI